MNKIKVGISIGDINGVGVEVVLKTFSDSRILDFCTPIIFANAKVLNYYKRVLNLKTDFFISNNINNISEKKLNCINVWTEDIEITPGKSTKIAGQKSLESLVFATKCLKKENIDVLVTAPINKDNIQSKDFSFPGHTEFLEQNLDGKSLMFLVSDSLKVGVVTGHIPISKVSESITQESIISKAKLMNESLKKDFAIASPKIAILGLNPHSGDNGLIGKEELEVVNPAIEKLKKDNILAFGAYPADGFFASGQYSKFDAVLAMYHDQGLIPFKSIAFGEGVNFTAGLSRVRTSPDHGTAYGLAGKGVADASSFREAVFAAIKIFKNRKDESEK